MMKNRANLALLFAVAACCGLFQGTLSSSVTPKLDCGIRFPIQSTRTIGGKDAGPWPWQAKILYKHTDGNIHHWCGGTLINDQWVLTAAYCVAVFERFDNARVVLGEHDITKNETYEQHYFAIDIRVHKNVSAPNYFENDIGLIKLDRKVKFTDRVKAACLPAKNSRIAPGSSCYMTGWGYTDTFITQGRAVPSNVLQEAKVPVVDHATCSSAPGHLFRIHDKTMLCVGYGKTKNISGCYGDNGGPLSCEEKGRYFVRGAVSWGDPACKPSNWGYTVFTRISSYIDWIETQMKNPGPTFQRCTDSHWFCKKYATRMSRPGQTFCTDFGFKAFMKNYCPITCRLDPTCFPGTKKTKKTKFHSVKLNPFE